MDSENYFKVESRKLRLFGIIYSGAENRTRQTGRVIGDLYSPDSFDTRLGKWASANVQPCTAGFKKRQLFCILSIVLELACNGG